MKVDKILSVLVVLVLVVTGVIAGLKMRGGEGETAPVALSGDGDASLVVIGIQGLEMSMVERLAADGRLPNLARLIANGATGAYSTLGRNVDPRIVWTSLVTGMLPENQGVGGTKVSRRGDTIQAPLVPSSRTVGTLWTYLSDAGRSCGVLGWPGTWPVEELDGVMVGPLSTYVLEREHGGNPEQAVSPSSEYERLDPFVLEAMHYARRDLMRFINTESVQGLEALVGQNYIVLSGARAADRSAVDLATVLVSDGDVENLFVCLAGTDAVSQRFWHYMDTEAIEMVDVSDIDRRLLEGQVEALGQTVERYYEYIDELVGELVSLAGDDGTVAIVSDHGYAGIPLDASGSPLVGTHMHSEEGVLIAAGPRVAPGTTAGHGQLIDVAPTIMAAAGIDLPPSLDGEVHREIIAR